MREIKFRFWLPEIKKMIGPFRLEEIIKAKRPVEGFEVMQYIGLKDKNGKDIYEGDIIYNGERHYGKSFEVVLPRKELAVPDSDPYESCTNIFGWNLGDYYDEETSEVVGNIFESPEVLGCPETAEYHLKTFMSELQE